jgi:Fur family ferric uptake transcriptional regulator
MRTDKPSNNKLNRSCFLILQALDQSKQLSSAQQIHMRLREEHGDEAPGLTTIYRSLEQLTKLSLVQSTIIEGERYYERLESGRHHHHLICTNCHANVHLDDCFIEDFSGKVQDRHGFVVRSHILEMFGLCAECLSKGP